MSNKFEDLYGGMSDDELLRIAASGDDLVPDAEAAFLAEIERRGIQEEANELRANAKLPPTQPPKKDDPAWNPDLLRTPVASQDLVVDGIRDLVVVERYRDTYDAQLAQGALQSAGIDAILRDENTVRADWFWSDAIGGVRLLVDRTNASDAFELLQAPTLESFETTYGERFEHPACPKCESRETYFEQLHKPIVGLSLWLGIPVPVQRNEWHCERCGHHWKAPQE